MRGCRRRCGRDCVRLDAAGEQRVVCNHRARPDHDAGEAVSRFVDMAARRLARHPSAVARVRCDLAVERHGVFEHYKWSFLCDVVEEHLVPLSALGLAHAGFYLDARVPQNLHALSGTVVTVKGDIDRNLFLFAFPLKVPESQHFFLQSFFLLFLLISHGPIPPFHFMVCQTVRFIVSLSGSR